MTYCKLISSLKIEIAPVNKDGICNYNRNIEKMLEDGYKSLTIVEKPQTIRKYHIEYEETLENISEIIVYEETQKQAEERIAQQERQQKIDEINSKINELEQMSIYESLMQNEQNVQIYKDVIKGLEETRDNL